VLIDPQSGDVQTDLAGLATGGGIGVLNTVAGVAPGNIDLIAPKGAVDAGDAGIRVSGNLNVAAARVLNAGNIAVGGSSAGTPAGAPASASVPSVTPTSTTAATNSTASEQATAQQKQQQASQTEETPSIITVEVIGYGGGDSSTDEERQRREQPQT
jgi:hypothetical protein